MQSPERRSWIGRGWGQFKGSKRLQVGPIQSIIPTAHIKFEFGRCRIRLWRSRGTLRQGLLTRPRGLLPRERRRRVQGRRPPHPDATTQASAGRPRRCLSRSTTAGLVAIRAPDAAGSGGYHTGAPRGPAGVARSRWGAVNAAAHRRASRERLLGHSAGRAGSGHGRSLPPVWGLSSNPPNEA